MQIGLEVLSNLGDAIKHYPNENWGDALSKGQLESKEWLIKQMLYHYDFEDDLRIIIVGSWLGILPMLMWEEREFFHWTDEKCMWGIDLSMDSVCASIHVNDHNNFQTFIGDVIEDNWYDKPAYYINTSCEHFTGSDFRRWLMMLPKGSKVALQSNNFFDAPDHVNCQHSLAQFEYECTLLAKIDYIDCLKIDNVPYTRFMILGQM